MEGSMETDELRCAWHGIPIFQRRQRMRVRRHHPSVERRAWAFSSAASEPLHRSPEVAFAHSNRSDSTTTTQWRHTIKKSLFVGCPLPPLTDPDPEPPPSCPPASTNWHPPPALVCRRRVPDPGAIGSRPLSSPFCGRHCAPPAGGRLTPSHPIPNRKLTHPLNERTNRTAAAA